MQPVGINIGGGMPPVAGVAVPAGGAAGAIAPTPSFFSMASLNKLVENVLGGTLHAASEVLRTGMVLTDLNGGIDPDFDQVERTTVMGDLPNAPSFQAAAEHNHAPLSARFDTERQNPANTQGERDVLNRLNGLNLGNAQRGGAPLALDAAHFHSALLHGAHFTLNDGGALYNQLQGDAQGQLVARGSSHYKSQPAQQFGMDLPGGLGHLLVGRTDTGGSFFQLESHGVGNGVQGLANKFVDLVGHTQSWLQHIGSSDAYVQIGPHGCIEGSEKDNKHVVL